MQSSWAGRPNGNAAMRISAILTAFEEEMSKKCAVYVMLAREAYRAAFCCSTLTSKYAVEVMDLLGLEAKLVSGRLGYVGLFQFYHIGSIQQQYYRKFPGLGKIHCSTLMDLFYYIFLVAV